MPKYSDVNMNVGTQARDLERARQQLAQAIKARKCHGCGCFLHALGELEGNETNARALSPLLAEARSVTLAKEYDCLGCAECWPAIALDALTATSASSSDAVPSCPTNAPKARRGWPPLPGDYEPVRYLAPVAVCSLNSETLARRLATHAPDGLAIAGTLHTENLGIERIILNTIANPNIRYLVLCGEDTQQVIGHLPGRSLESLFRHGLDERGRIRNAPGKRPFLKNVTAEQVNIFLRQVSLISRIGEDSEPKILAEIRAAAIRSPGRFEETPLQLPIEAISADEPRRLIPDPAGYFVIYVDAYGARLVLDHYTNAGILDCVIEGTSSTALYNTAIERGLVTRLDHAAYLGREMARAELSLQSGETYVQDRAPGELEPQSESRSCGCVSDCASGDSR